VTARDLEHDALIDVIDGDPGPMRAPIPDPADAGIEELAPSSVSEQLTDLGNARRLVRRHGSEMRCCQGRWLVWAGGRWRQDDNGEVERRAKQTAVSIYAEVESCRDADERSQVAKHARRSEAEPRIRAMMSLAATEPGVVIRPDDLDAEPYLLGCGNGTLDLRTGDLRRSDPADLLSRGTDVEFVAEAECPRWLEFLGEVFDGDRELVAFLQRFVGYSLTGDTREHVLAVLHGSGCNGKSTLVEVVKRLLGGFASTASFETFVKARGDRGPRNDLARLHRARMVIASESGKGRRLDEATMKSLTGGDTVTARFLHQEHFEFRPEFKLWLVTNHRPRVDGSDDAIWRRLRLVPFEVNFAGREDRLLTTQLEQELPGILNWAIEGCIAWQQDGLGDASAVRRATAEYRADEDTLGAFLAERCVQEGSVDTGALREAYEVFCDAVGEQPMGASLLGRELADRGIRRGGKGRGRYQGVDLR
jgi:putative DNA primase/helicase